MLSMIRRRFTFANVAMTLVLVFAMSGGAYAAGKFLITSTKQISPKVLKSLQGKAGKNGAPGASGATGTAGVIGPAGATGPQGPAGPAGVAGAKGENGVSVTSAVIAKSSSTCSKQGGSEFTSAGGKATACNGAEGSPWTAGGTLPSGKTETGVWSFGPLTIASEGSTSLPLASFPIPLAAPLGSGHAHFIQLNGMEINLKGEEVAPTECGSGIGPEVNASHPQAKPGNLCVYTSELTKAFTESAEMFGLGKTGEGSAGTAGAFALFVFEGGTEIGLGAWAVTAE
ncbi:MAG: hypothetical protein WAN93_00260 [Solirubrobacteraceae bacterium]